MMYMTEFHSSCSRCVGRCFYCGGKTIKKALPKKINKDIRLMKVLKMLVISFILLSCKSEEDRIIKIISSENGTKWYASELFKDRRYNPYSVEGYFTKGCFFVGSGCTLLLLAVSRTKTPKLRL